MRHGRALWWNKHARVCSKWQIADWSDGGFRTGFLFCMSDDDEDLSSGDLVHGDTFTERVHEAGESDLAIFDPVHFMAAMGTAADADDMVNDIRDSWGDQPGEGTGEDVELWQMIMSHDRWRQATGEEKMQILDEYEKKL